MARHFVPKCTWLQKIVADHKADPLAGTRKTHFPHDVIPVAFDRVW
jgi:hypothetical protein